MIRILGIIVMFYAYVGLAYGQQQENWGKLFDDLTSRERSLSDPARVEALKTVVPRLLREDRDLLEAELDAVTPQFSRNEAVRLQASAIFASVAYGRQDSANVLGNYLSLLVSQLQDGNQRVRYNACFSLSSLQPAIPSKLAEPLMSAVQDQSQRVASAAIVGVARLASSIDEASKLVDKIATADKRPGVRIAALQAMGRFQLNSPEHTSALIESLSASNAEIVKTGLWAVSGMGPDLIRSPAPKLRDIARDNSDPEIRDLASRIIQSGSPR